MINELKQCYTMLQGHCGLNIMIVQTKYVQYMHKIIFGSRDISQRVAVFGFWRKKHCHFSSVTSRHDLQIISAKENVAGI